MAVRRVQADRLRELDVVNRGTQGNAIRGRIPVVNIRVQLLPADRCLKYASNVEVFRNVFQRPASQSRSPA
jgi:hypothetical protein